MPRDSELHPNDFSFVGGSEYLDTQPDFREEQARIYVKFRPAGSENTFLGLLDTGAHYCILGQEIVSSIEDRLTERIGKRSLLTAHGLLHGDLYIHQITMIAEIGANLEIDVAVLALRDWAGPSFLGYSGALDRVQFAIHPGTNRFSFGSLG